MPLILTSNQKIMRTPNLACKLQIGIHQIFLKVYCIGVYCIFEKLRHLLMTS